jgi:hypothetical protein
MSKYLVIACIPCLLSDTEIFLNDMPFKFGSFEHANDMQAAIVIRDDMAKWCNRDHIVIFDRAEVEALINGGKQ